MALGTAITVVGNLTGDPELRYTPTGTACVVLVVAVNARRYDKLTDKWTDGETSFYRVTGWRSLAENAAESLHKGDRVVVSGEISQRHWEDSAGEKKSAWNVTAAAIGPDLTYATAKVTKMARTRGEVAPDDPWSTGARERPVAATAGGPHDEEPPF